MIDRHFPAPPSGDTQLIGKLTHAGTINVGDDENVTGVFVDIDRDILRDAKHLPMYERVTVAPFSSDAAMMPAPPTTPPSETPLTDAACWIETNAANAVVLASFARQLERDNAALRREKENLVSLLQRFFHDGQSLGASHPHFAEYVCFPSSLWDETRAAIAAAQKERT